MAKQTAKIEQTITIPMDLARLLSAEPEDISDGRYEDVQKVAKSLLRLLMITKS